eukprot:6623455-Pyramimonas_sp.AAC.1
MLLPPTTIQIVATITHTRRTDPLRGSYCIQVAGCVVLHEGKVLLCRRAIEPCKGLWCSPQPTLTKVVFSKQLPAPSASPKPIPCLSAVQ